VFKLSATGTFTTLATFDGANGANPYAGLIADRAGNLYGTTYAGGAANNGTIFKLTDTGFQTPTPGIPEPASWALMFGGFAFVGISARRQRSAFAA
jgi:uncharacterized repeat protein (TIGR03803 family)